jgi:hypothetical protein
MSPLLRGVPRIALLLLAATTIALPARADQAPARPQATALPAQSAPLLPEAAIRTGNHTDFGRVVFDLPVGATSEVGERDGKMTVVLRNAAAARGAVLAPRNVDAITVATGQVTIALSPGVKWQATRPPGMLIIDIFDAPAPPTPAAPASLPPVASPPVASLTVASPTVAPQAVESPTIAESSIEPARNHPLWSGPAPRGFHHDVAAPPAVLPPVDADAAPVTTTPGTTAPRAAAPIAATPAPAAADPAMPSDPSPPTPSGAAVAAVASAPLSLAPLSLAPLSLAAAAEGQTLALPFAAGTGAAAFRRGEDAVVVFDERRPIDLAALRDDPAFATARVQVLPAATVLRMAIATGTTLRLTHSDDGWSLALIPDDKAMPLAPIHSDAADGRMLLQAAAAGRVISVPDPETGGVLLVGTQTQTGQGVVVARHTPDFDLLASFQGVAIEPRSDALSLHALAPGFVLEGRAASPLALDQLSSEAAAVADAARLTRRGDFPGLP